MDEPPTKSADETHDWFEPPRLVPRMEACRLCGVVRRADRKNKPCKGQVYVGLRSGHSDLNGLGLDEVADGKPMKFEG